MLSDTTEVTCLLTPKSPETAGWTRAFCHARRLWSHRVLELSGSSAEATALLPDDGIFQCISLMCVLVIQTSDID